MATLQIENLPEDLYQSIQRLATTANVSINEAVIQILSQATTVSPIDRQQKQQREPNPALARLRSFPRKNPAEFGLADSTLLIREDRDR
ncbi:MAG: hypothetical protein WBB01_05030 [Phormidesmis sp.]